MKMDDKYSNEGSLAYLFKVVAAFRKKIRSNSFNIDWDSDEQRVTYFNNIFEIMDNATLTKKFDHLIDELSLQFGYYANPHAKPSLIHVESLIYLYLYYHGIINQSGDPMKLFNRRLCADKLKMFDEQYNKNSLFSPQYFIKNYYDFVKYRDDIYVNNDADALEYQIDMTNMYMDILRLKIKSDYLIRAFGYSTDCIDELDRELGVYLPKMFIAHYVGTTDLDANTTYLSKIRKTSKFIDKMFRIGSKQFIQDSNHKAYYVKELDVCFVHNGFHSIAYGDLKHKIQLKEVKTYSIESLFDSYRFDGTHYVNNDGNNCDSKVIGNELLLNDYWRNYTVDCLYELARNKYFLQKKL